MRLSCYKVRNTRQSMLLFTSHDVKTIFDVEQEQIPTLYSKTYRASISRISDTNFSVFISLDVGQPGSQVVWGSKVCKISVASKLLEFDNSHTGLSFKVHYTVISPGELLCYFDRTWAISLRAHNHHNSQFVPSHAALDQAVRVLNLAAKDGSIKLRLVHNQIYIGCNS